MANIALGGYSEEESTILRNEIFDARCEGIFIIEAFKVRIMMNKIYKNHTGITCINSSPLIFKNKIYKNTTHGIYVLKRSLIHIY